MFAVSILVFVDRALEDAGWSQVRRDPGQVSILVFVDRALEVFYKHRIALR